MLPEIYKVVAELDRLKFSLNHNELNNEKIVNIVYNAIKNINYKKSCSNCKACESFSDCNL